MHEAQMYDANSFVTLTYRDEDLPKDGSVSVRTWQLFAKRLRKRFGSFRFYHCGEYGDRSLRPHYHACLFGLDFAYDRMFFRQTKSGDRLYTSQALNDVWGLGFCVIGDLTFESAAYVSRYVTKKVTGARAAAHYGGRKPEYATMSRRPGIGASWLDRWKDEVYPRDQVIVRGRPERPPRFYDDQVDEMELAPVVSRRRAALEKRGPVDLAAREKNMEARLGLVSREV